MNLATPQAQACMQPRDFAISNSKTILAFAKRYAPALGKMTIHNDLYSEKAAAFESTKTYLAIKQAYAATYGTPPYARLPEVEINSPKIRFIALPVTWMGKERFDL